MLCDICHTEYALPNFAVCQKHYEQILIMREALDEQSDCPYDGVCPVCGDCPYCDYEDEETHNEKCSGRTIEKFEVSA